MRLKTLFLLVLGIYIPFTKAQNLGSCGTQTIEITAPKSLSCNNNGSDFLTKYRTPEFWIPDANTPIKTVRVNIVVCRKDNGSNGWQNTQAFRDEVELTLQKVNYIYGNSFAKGYELKCEPQINYISDSKIRFELNEIIFINNTAFNKLGQGGVINSANVVQDYLLQNHPSASYCLNHIFTQPPLMPDGSFDYSGGGWWGYYGYDYAQNFGLGYIHTRNSMYSDSYMSWDAHIEHIAHEYGHALGLHHTYNSEYTDITHYDFLDDVFGLCAETSVLNANNSCYANCGQPNKLCPPTTPGANEITYLNTDCFFLNYPGPYPMMANTPNNANRSQIYISPKMAGRMHRALSLYENKFKLGNIEMPARARGPHPSTSIPHYISTNETWDFTIKMYQNIVVLPGATLTIKCKVSMPPYGHIDVKSGGKLIIDGGILTNEFEGGWGGVIVNGDPTKQMVMGGNADHGYVELKNGAKIEKATIGIDAQYGGVINASNSDFYNNNVSIRAANYPGVSANGWNGPTYYPLTGISVVKNCRFNFEQDPEYDNLPNFSSFIKFETIKGFNVLGNTFEVLTPASQTGTVYGKGINAIESAFKVDWLNSNQKNKFTNLEYGIYSGTFYRFDRVTEVMHTDFSSNAYGILLEGTQFSKVTQNNFKIENIPYTGLGTRRYGLYLKGCTGYQVNDNNFYSVNGGGELVGCVVWNSLYAANFIKANTFSNLLVGAISSGNNLSLEQITNWNSPNNFQAGLQILCNNFNTNATDIFVAGGSNPFSPGLAPGGGNGGGGVPLFAPKGMGSYQGACVNNTTTANNRFSSGNHIIYDYPQLRGTIYSHPNNSQFTPASGKYTTTNVVLNNCNGIPNRNCITKYIFNDITAIKGTLLTAKATSNQLKLLLDNNNTSGLLNTINNLSFNSSQVKNQLNLASPYLSDEVLKASITRQIPLNNAHLKQIVIDNSPLSEEVFLELNPMLNSFSNGNKQQILNAQTGISERTLLQSKIIVAEADAQEAINDAVRYYLTSDNIQSPLDSVITLLETYSNNKINMQLTAFYIIKHDFVKAQQYIDNMSNIAEYVDVAKLFTVAMELEIANLKCYEVNQQQKDDVLEVANGTCQNSSHLAEALLKYYYSLSYPEYVEIPNPQNQTFARAANTSTYDSSVQTNESVYMTNEEVKNHYAEFIKSSNKQTNKSTLTNEQSEFLVYPNPAKDQITVFYDFENNNNNTVIELTDISGKLILQKRMPANESEKTISLEKISSGFYLLVLKNNNAIVSTKKLSIEN